MSREELLVEARKLSEGERAVLADALQATLPVDPEWEAAWMEEVKRRMARYDAGETTASLWRDVMERVQQRLPGGKV